MELNAVMRKTAIFLIVMMSVLFTCGCIESAPSNVTVQQISPVESPFPQVTNPPLTTVPPTQNQTSVTPVTAVPTITPHFTGTITFGSNRSLALTEDQAWKYAAAYLETIGMRDIPQSNINPHGQGIWTFDNGTQTMSWSFEVYHTVPDIGRYPEGNIIIDAYDGHVLDMSYL